MSNILEPEGDTYRIEQPAANTALDLSQPPQLVGGGGLPLLTGVDPRYPSCWRRLPGFRRLSTTINNSRIIGTEVGAGATDQVDADFFKPIVVRYGSQPYERRGFVVSANNKLIFKYYDTKTSTWTVRTLISDLDTTFGTRTDFDVCCEGKFLYVSKDANTGVPNTELRCPYVFWWDDDRSLWSSIGGGIQGTVHAIVAQRDKLYVGGRFSIVGGASTGQAGYIYANFAMWSSQTQTWAPIGRFVDSADSFETTTVYALAIWKTNTSSTTEFVVIGGDFAKAQLPLGDVANTKCLASYNTVTGEITNFGNGVATGTVVRSIVRYLNGTDYDLFIGGNFTQVNNAAAVNCQSCAWYQQAATAWNGMGATYPAATVRSMGITGTRLYVGGSFTRKLLYFDIGSTTWKHPKGTDRTAADPGSPDDDVYAVALLGTDVVFGGKFTSIGATSGYLKIGVVNSSGAYTKLFNGGGNLAPDEVRSIAFKVDNTFYIAIKSNGTAQVWGVSSAPQMLAGTSLIDPSAFKMDGTDTTQGNVDAYTGQSGLQTVFVSSAFDQVERVYVGGEFYQAGYIRTQGIASWFALLQGTFINTIQAQVGSARYEEFGAGAQAFDKPFGTSYPWINAQMKNGNYRYQYFLRLANSERGMIGPISSVRRFTMSAALYATRHFWTEVVLIPRTVLARLRPTELQVWRTVGGIDSSSNPVDLNGPFYLENVYPIDPDIVAGSYTDYLDINIALGVLSDEALAAKDAFDPRYDLAQSPSESKAIGVVNSMMYSLAGSRLRGQADRNLPETYFDVRWSPPWIPQNPPYVRTESTSFSGFKRTRVVGSEVPRFLPVGNYMMLLCRQQLVRFVKNGDYIEIADGPSGIGVAGRHAACAVAGELFFVGVDGEFFKCNVANMSVEELPGVSRWIRQRFEGLLSASADTDRIMVGYDPASKMILITARPATSTAGVAIPSDGLAISTTTLRTTLISDLNVAGMGEGVDPETGRKTLLLINRAGTVLAPDWQDHGVWASDSTWKNRRFLTMNGAQTGRHNTVSALADQGGGTWRITTTGTFEMSGSFGMALNQVAYLFRPNPSADSSDATTRMQLLFCGTIIAMTSTTIDVKVSAISSTVYDRFFFISSFTGLSLTGLVVIVGPMLYQVGLPCPRDLQEPSAFDAAVIQSVAAVPGRIASEIVTPDNTRDFIIPGALVLDSVAWRHNQYQYDGSAPGPILPWSAGQSNNGAMSFPIVANQDDMCVQMQERGHHVMPILTCFSPDLFFELIDTEIEVTIDKRTTGIEPPD